MLQKCRCPSRFDWKRVSEEWRCTRTCARRLVTNESDRLTLFVRNDLRYILFFLILFVPSLIARSQYAHYPEITGGVQSIDNSHMPDWLTLDASIRGRTEYQSAVNFVSGDEPVYELERLRLGARFHPTDWFVGYVQVHDTRSLGLVTKDISANMKDTFDIRQALISLRKGNAQLIVGRQPLKFGDERLIGISDWTNVSRTFDALDLRYGGANRVDFFTSSVVNICATCLDRSQGGLHLHGAVGSLNAWIPHTAVSPYFFVKTFKGVMSKSGETGMEREFTVGVFEGGDLPGHFFHSARIAVQRGTYAGDSSDALAGIVKGGYIAETLPWAPELSAEYEYASGDRDVTERKRRTFDQLYPSDHNAFGLVDIFGWQNIKERRVNLTLKQSKNLSVTLQGGSLYLATRYDSIYSASGMPLKTIPEEGFASDSLASEFDASCKYIFHRDMVFNAGVGHLFPGQAMTSSRAGGPLTLGFFSLTYRFEVRRPTDAGGSLSIRTKRLHSIPSLGRDE